MKLESPLPVPLPPLPFLPSVSPSGCWREAVLLCTLTSPTMNCSSRARPREVRMAAPAATFRLREGIDSVLSRWHGLRLAVDNKWGGRDSARKYISLVDDIVSWLYLSGGDVCVEELENFLHESMLLTFHTEIEDGSIEEVAEQLMILHQEYQLLRMTRETPSS